MSNNPSQPTNDLWQGRVLKYHSNLFTVEIANDTLRNDSEGSNIASSLYQCTLKGLLKKEGTSVITGDTVCLDSFDEINKTARIIQVLPRQNELPRPKIANVDQVVIVHPFREPDFDGEQLDRFLTHIALAGVQAIICVSKSDLGFDPAHPDKTNIEKKNIIELYEKQLQIPVIFTSIHNEASLNALTEKIKGRVSVLAGLSGAGKSSLLNRLNPNLEIKVQAISEKIGRGTHTTRHVELIHVSTDILIADTPGFSNLKFNYTLPQSIEEVFPDFAPFRQNCAFSNCLHLDEEGCAVLKALGTPEAHSQQTIHPQRYASYQALIAEAQEYKKEQKKSSQKEAYGHKTLHSKGKETKQIIRLKSKAREGSRRTLKQEVSSLIEEEEDDEIMDL